jgi:hypothetical protein
MSYSTSDELEQIERAARSSSEMPSGDGLAPAPPPAPMPPPAPAPAPKGRRRGSSTFTMPKGGTTVDYRAKPAAAAAPAPSAATGHALLEPFGTRGTEKPAPTVVNSYQPPAPVVVRPPAPVAAAKRASVVMKPMVGAGGLVDLDDPDFDDSDDDDDDDDDDERLPGKPMPGVSNGAAVGGPHHRPLVGGFAAAAYEAARAHHYATINKGKEKVAIPKRAGPPPSI